jgi:hypothetical protein
MFIKKFFRKLKEAHEERKYRKDEEYFKRTSNKYYRPEEDEKPQFSEDYFKSSDNEATRKQHEELERKAREQAKRQVQGEQPMDEPKQSTGNDSNDPRRMRFSNGVTIIDDRDPSYADRKIFSSNEGEYTEFEEVN